MLGTLECLALDYLREPLMGSSSSQLLNNDNFFFSFNVRSIFTCAFFKRGLLSYYFLKCLDSLLQNSCRVSRKLILEVE